MVGPNAAALAAVAWAAYHPNLVLAVDPEGTGGDTVPLLAGRARGDETLAYVCERMACAAPVAAAGDLRRLLNQR